MTKLFSGPKVTPPPEPTPAAPMPDLNSQAVQDAKKNRTAQIMGRSGRGSTIMSQAQAIGDYAKEKLG